VVCCASWGAQLGCEPIEGVDWEFVLDAVLAVVVVVPVVREEVPVVSERLAVVVAVVLVVLEAVSVVLESLPVVLVVTSVVLAAAAEEYQAFSSIAIDEATAFA
jgi:hypothetical protein